MWTLFTHSFSHSDLTSVHFSKRKGKAWKGKEQQESMFRLPKPVSRVRISPAYTSDTEKERILSGDCINQEMHSLQQGNAASFAASSITAFPYERHI